MSFFKNIKSSIYDPGFYSKIKSQSLGKALIYFLLLALCLTIINVLILSYELGVKVPQEIRNFIGETINRFPADLEVSIDEGQVTTNAAEPYFIPLPQSEDFDQNNFNNILVIDTKTPFSSAQFDQYKTMAWLTKDSLFYQNREFDQRSLDLSKVENITINRGFIEGLVTKIDPWIKFVGPVLIFIVFIGLFIGFLFNLIYFFFLAVLIFFLASIFKWGLNYSASYKTAIYSSTLAFIVDLIIFNTGVYTGFFGFPFLFTLTALCITTINLQNFDQKV